MMMQTMVISISYAMMVTNEIGSTFTSFSLFYHNTQRSRCYNYPARQFGLESNKAIKIRFFTQRVTNVDPAPTICSATLRSRKGVDITVTPTRVYKFLTRKSTSMRNIEAVYFFLKTFELGNQNHRSILSTTQGINWYAILQNVFII